MPQQESMYVHHADRNMFGMVDGIRSLMATQADRAHAPNPTKAQLQATLQDNVPEEPLADGRTDTDTRGSGGYSPVEKPAECLLIGRDAPPIYPSRVPVQGLQVRFECKVSLAPTCSATSSGRPAKGTKYQVDGVFVGGGRAWRFAASSMHNSACSLVILFECSSAYQLSRIPGDKFLGRRLYTTSIPPLARLPRGSCADRVVPRQERRRHASTPGCVGQSISPLAADFSNVAAGVRAA